jgi:hypothetical protein
MTGGSALMKGFGSIIGGRAQGASASYASQVARNNAIVAEQNAQYAITVGEGQAVQQGMKTGALIGTQKAKQGASGVDVNMGSPAAVRESTAELGRFDELTILSNAMQKAHAFRTQAMNFEAEAGLHSQRASYARTAGMIEGFSSLIGGASSVSDKWLHYQRVGVL